MRNLADFSVVVYTGSPTSRTLTGKHTYVFDTEEDARSYAAQIVNTKLVDAATGKMYFPPHAAAFRNGAQICEFSSRMRRRFLRSLRQPSIRIGS